MPKTTFSDYPFSKGDKARYTGSFLRNTGQITDSDGTHGWAEVTDVSPFGKRALVTLKWPNGIERRVLDANLMRQGGRLRVQDVAG